ncbi:MAG: threonylcarbamoyl-AMP synthase [Gammaproteobacteria bacterium]|nr:MAG: threonylcarbamoyl-AMP synthase [Gammaproteobacteria bacterium]RKZ71872.1 MAG: threonylcarbamoyl-AMP synthase [Gammaproteobacteria bacterium]
MTQVFEIHSENPQKRLIQSAASIVRDGGVVVYPTDSCYALGCHIGDKTALEKIQRIRSLDKKHNLTLLCRDLSEIGIYAKVHNSSFRLMKAATPGPYTFLLVATRDVPKRLQHPKRKTIGVRVPDNQIILDLLEELGEPMLSTSLILPGDNDPMTDPEEIADRLCGQIDLVIDGGACGMDATTVVDLADGQAVLVREGMGDISAVGL